MNKQEQETKTDKMNYQVEYIKSVYMQDPAIGGELARLNFPAPKPSTPPKSKNKGKK